MFILPHHTSVHKLYSPYSFCALYSLVHFVFCAYSVDCRACCVMCVNVLLLLSKSCKLSSILFVFFRFNQLSWFWVCNVLVVGYYLSLFLITCYTFIFVQNVSRFKDAMVFCFSNMCPSLPCVCDVFYLF